MGDDQIPEDAAAPDIALLLSIAHELPLLVSYIDPERRYRFVNRRHREWFGQPEAAFLGRHVREALGETRYASLAPHLDDALGGRSVAFEQVFEVPGERARWMGVTLTPHVEAGVVRGVVSSWLDVTERQQMEKDLRALTQDLGMSVEQGTRMLERQARDLADSREATRESEARIRAILESAVDGIIAIDEEGRIESFNPAAERLFGYAAAEVLGRNVSMLMPSPYHEEHDGYLASYRSTGRRKIIGIGREVVARRKDGEEFPIHLAVGEARVGDRRFFSGFIHDLSPRKRLEEQLAHSSKMEAVGRLAGGVAHDFNNILLTILGRCEALLRRLEPGDPLARQVVEIEKAGRRAASLTRQLLAVSRRQVLKPRLVDLNAVLQDTAGMLRRLVGEDVALRMDLQPDIGPVKVDPDQLVQVLLNLVVNARDAMPRGGEVAIETRDREPPAGGSAGEEGARPGRFVRLAVRDTGMGMDEQTRARIFEPYFTTKGEKGTGLGLSTVYGIVEQSGGGVQVESAPGSGTTFRIDFPRADGPAEAARRPRGSRAAVRRAGTVLLVEDDLSARRALEEFLAEEGHTVLAAANGPDAERLFRESPVPVDVVVTDMVLPLMSGPDLVRRLRAARPGIKVLFMSGHTPETVLQQGGVGDASFLQKPFKVADLLSRVGQLIESATPPKRRRATRGPEPSKRP